MNVKVGNVTVTNSHELALGTQMLTLAVAAGKDLADVESALGNSDLAAHVRKVALDEGFVGKSGSTLFVRDPGSNAKVLLCGTGEEDPDMRLVAATAARFVAKGKKPFTSLGFSLPSGQTEDAALRGLGHTLLGVRHANFQDPRYTNKADQWSRLEEVTLVTDVTSASNGKISHYVGRANAIADGVNLTRKIVDMPANDCNPVYLEQHARDLVARWGPGGSVDHGQIEIKIIKQSDLRDLGAQLVMAVGGGSKYDPRIIQITYTPAQDSNKPPIAFVGKGISFDAGGYNLKSTGAIEDMRIDMGGWAANIGFVDVVRVLGADRKIVVLGGIAENMVDSGGYRTGDIITSLSGKRVKVINTDAEGRLVLADCIAYAASLGITRIIDLATLTGAGMVALGHEKASIFSRHELFLAEVMAAAKSAGDEVWHMPILKSSAKRMKDSQCDLRNFASPSDRLQGVCDPAYFLDQFAGEAQLVHLDIAGTAYLEKPFGYLSKGATGFGVGTLVELVCP